MDEQDARILAFEFMATTDRRADDVYRWLRRLLGHPERRRARPVNWSDAFDLLVVLILDSETFAAGIRRRVRAAELRIERGDNDKYGHDRERALA